MAQELSRIFSQPVYVMLAASIFVGLFLALSFMSQYLFFQPFLSVFLPPEGIPGFLLIIAVAVMSGIVITMNVYRVRISRNSTKKMRGGFLGSVIGASAGCASCGSIGFAVVSVFGTTAGIATSFFTTYEIPLRLASLAILGYTFYTTKKSLHSECKIKN